MSQDVSKPLWSSTKILPYSGFINLAVTITIFFIGIVTYFHDKKSVSNIFFVLSSKKKALAIPVLPAPSTNTVFFLRFSIFTRII